MRSIPFLILSIFTSTFLSACYPCSKIVLHTGTENNSGSTWVAYERIKSNLFYSKHMAIIFYTNGPHQGKLGATNKPFKNPEQAAAYIFGQGPKYAMLKRTFFDFKKYYNYQETEKAKDITNESHAPGGPIIEKKDENRSSCLSKILKCLTFSRAS